MRYELAITALRDLLAESDADSVERAFAEAIYDNRFNSTAKTVNGKYKDNAICIERLRGGRCNERRRSSHTDFEMCEGHLIPSADHTCGYIRDRTVVAIVTEPSDLSFKDLKELVEFCLERDLRADIDAESSYFPSRTIRIIIRNRDDNEV